MRKYLFLIPLVCVFAACNPNNPEPKPIDDGMRHDSLTAIYDLFANPERGFHTAKEFHSPNPTAMTPGTVKISYDLGTTLIHIDYYLEDYRNTLIPESYLEVVRQNMQALREGGCKCILRFAYTGTDLYRAESYATNYEDPREAPLDLILQHIAQIKPILQENSDVIFAMETGFVGIWGEWYYTTNFKMNPIYAEDYADRRKVLDALLDALPAERQLCVRTPTIKMKCYGWTFADTLTRAEAFTNTPKARLASHDDAFMADQNDMGTFGSNLYREYWASESKYLIFGGETCQPSAYAKCDRTIETMKALHISYLNFSYHKSVINGWQKEGCLEDMKRLIGYRLVGTDVATTKEPKVGEELKVVLTLVNEGFSAPKNPRDIKMLLVNKANPSDVMTVVPDCDPRLWGPEGEHKVSVSFRPKTAGEYNVYLYLPDPKSSLAADPRYAIRLANKDCWDEKTGYNYLTTITVE